jgi:hypothetical protein
VIRSGSGGSSRAARFALAVDPGTNSCGDLHRERSDQPHRRLRRGHRDRDHRQQLSELESHDQHLCCRNDAGRHLFRNDYAFGVVMTPSSLRRKAYGRAANRVIRVVIGVLIAAALTAAICGPVSLSAAATVPGARAASAGSIGIQLLEVPLAAASDPRAHLYIVDHLHPGTVIRRWIEISNTTASTVHVLLYPAAAAISEGKFVGAAEHTPNELSTWTSVLPGTSEVPPGGHTIASVTVAVPDDARPGEQYGVVWAETRSAPSGGQGITQVNRVGIRLYVSVSTGGPPASAFTIGSIVAKRSPNGQPVVLATVRNTGGRALDMNGTLLLAAGPGGSAPARSRPTSARPWQSALPSRSRSRWTSGYPPARGTCWLRSVADCSNTVLAQHSPFQLAEGRASRT